MRKTHLAFATLLIVLTAAVGFGQKPGGASYMMPPKEIVAAFDAQPLPTAVLSPTKQVMALTFRKAQRTTAPFKDAPGKVARTEWRFTNLSFTEKGTAEN